MSTVVGDPSLPIISLLPIPPATSIPSASGSTQSNTQPLSTPSLSDSSSASLPLSTSSSASLTDSSSSVPSSSFPLTPSSISSPTASPSTPSSSDPPTSTSTLFVSPSAEASPSAGAVRASSNSSFFHNKAAVAAVFTLTGICTVVLALWLLTCTLRRRRRRQLDREMDVAGAFIPDAARRAIEADDYEKAASVTDGGDSASTRGMWGRGPAFAPQLRHSPSSSHSLRHPPGLAPPPPNTAYAQWSSGYEYEYDGTQQQYANGGYVAPPAAVQLMREQPGQWVTQRDSPPATSMPVSLQPGQQSQQHAQVFDASPSPPAVPSKDSDYLSKYSESPPASSDGHGSAEEDDKDAASLPNPNPEEWKPHPLHVINE